MYEELRERVYQANMKLAASGLVVLTWGNVSEIDRKNGIIAIKPSGVGYADMKADDIVLVDLSGERVSGSMQPSSDTPTHIELYKALPAIYGITHTHSRFATAFAQARMCIPCYGTTHADVFYGNVPITRMLTKKEIKNEYERNTGSIIAETVGKSPPLEIPSALVAGHGPFSWGRDAEESVMNAIVLEETAALAFYTLSLNPGAAPLREALLYKHYSRKHGKDAYYGQMNGMR